jgi:hypothetical protein
MAGWADGNPAGGVDGTAGPAGTGDVIFKIARPRSSPLLNVGIDSVLYPLFGRVAQLEQRHAQVYRLIGLWRDRVAELVEHGWGPAADTDPAAAGRRVFQLRNCSPPFVAARPSSSCGFSSLCAFCWARAAMKIFKVAESVFFPAHRGPAGRCDSQACCLVETSRTHRLPSRDPEFLAIFLADRVRRPPRGTPVGPYFRQHEVQRYPILGGYETIAVSSEARGRNRGPWSVAIRQLLAIESEYLPLLAPPQYKKLRIRLSRHSRLDRLTLARAVARLCQYPPWLLRGDPTEVVDYLTARGNLRLWAAFGNFRGTRPGAGERNTED